MTKREMRGFAVAMAAMAAAIGLAPSALADTVVVDGKADLYNATAPGTLEGENPVSVNVSGFTSVTFLVSTGATVVLNTTTGNTYNDADGVGAAVSSSSNVGANFISGLTAPNAGFLTGVFVGSSVIASTPSSLDFTVGVGTSFTSLSPGLQQAFFIGDGLTGDGAGTTQVFYVPAGAKYLYLGISDACGYAGSPSCYDDNAGSFTATVSGATAPVPEPATWTMMLVGFGGVGAVVRGGRRRQAVHV